MFLGEYFSIKAGLKCINSSSEFHRIYSTKTKIRALGATKSAMSV